ncbi:hypothetical protein B0H10DRAFT_446864 [Mycena sp. CBHHK59/15]|nr:hypothetical protein B0H10DRAFT_446864 [Mycena sp. CBHHK59/15]
MADARPPLIPSSSFSASSSTTSPSRPLKRRLFSAPDLNFFVPAADSFKPLPYAPHHSATPARDHHAERVPTRPLVAHTLSTLGLDPLASDPNTVFIRHPFEKFPDQELYPEGLTYTALAENPNWFLDPDDFVCENSTNPAAIPYPAALEPPRGWCPARKKDLKDKGPEGWPDGEQPRLRCTFCRRTYAGVNAKSMWRRHVFEKHKIAMSNRRNDMERPRGRSSNKENKRGGKGNKPKEDTHETVMNLDATVPGAPIIPQGEFPAHLDVTTSAPASPSPLTRVIPPASPYDPLLTPSFRHSPPRLPSDQPWRFPSPSHPMHRSRELSLTMLGGASPAVVSPVKIRGDQPAVNSPLSSPCTPGLGFETPAKILPFPLGRALFSSRRVTGRSRTEEVSTPPPRARRRTRAQSDADVSDDWDCKPLSLLGRDADQNPFVAMYFEGEEEDNSPPSSSPEGESPVLRSALAPTGVGLGIGLLEPFVLPSPAAEVDLDELMEVHSSADETEVVDALTLAIEPPPLKKRRTSGGGR